VRRRRRPRPVRARDERVPLALRDDQRLRPPHRRDAPFGQALDVDARPWRAPPRLAMSAARPVPDSQAPPAAGGSPGGAAPMGERLRARGHRYEFFQAIRLLAAANGGPRTVGGPALQRESVHVTPDTAGVFPAS